MVQFFERLRRPSRSTLLPYPTLFRSDDPGAADDLVRDVDLRIGEALEPAGGVGEDRLFANTNGWLKGFPEDRKSTRLNSIHRCTSYAVNCLKQKAPKASITKEMPAIN